MNLLRAEAVLAVGIKQGPRPEAQGRAQTPTGLPGMRRACGAAAAGSLPPMALGPEVHQELASGGQVCGLRVQCGVK